MLHIRVTVRSSNHVDEFELPEGWEEMTAIEKGNALTEYEKVATENYVYCYAEVTD